MGSAVDDVNLVQRHGVHDFLALLQFSFGALYETGLCPSSVVIARPSEGAAKFGDFSSRFVDGYDIASLYLK